ncbi:Glucosamine-6-phosphate deaminase [Commensalibacter sp. Nvir]|uniref:glucosamine-6-phosphate deaminase n=1 Tax=Commensalibacter sp. Nvir TaxID=3069817 RepID=UPI002D6D9BB4|nr:Glucosamine-6-phosphate deaminase [Commensalibacter sp. Nvir]
MEVIIRPGPEQTAQLAALFIAHEIKQHSKLVLGLATGRTMERIYAILVNMHKNDGLDFSKCYSFNLDEYIGLPTENKNSYRSYMNYHLFHHININMINTHVPNGMAKDLKAEAKNYEKQIQKLGGIDLQLLGIGETGHIGFNEPLSALMSRTRDKSLTPRTRKQNAEMFGGDPNKVPTRALTMGVGTILEARSILLIALGKSKASILAKAIEGPITSMISASALQLHSSCKILVDETAASNLSGRKYYDWVFQNEPEYAHYR